MINYINNILNDTLKLVAIDSVQSAPTELSPFGDGVGKCLEEVLNIAKSLGYETKNEKGYYGIATIGKGEEFGILGHMDVVPYKDQSWTKKPLGEVINGVLYGRGVLDDKGPMVCCLYAVKKLIDDGFKPKKKIKFIFGGNEESGWKCIEHFNEVDKMPKEGFSPDADFPVINCEKGIVEIKVTLPKPKELLSLTAGLRANMVIDKCLAQIDAELEKSSDINISTTIEDGKTCIKTFGMAAHGSTPEKGDNAFLHTLNYLSETLGGIYTQLNNLLYSIKGEGLGINCSDDKSGDLSLNVGIAKIEQDNLVLHLDIRYPVSFNQDDIVNKVISKFDFANCKVVHFHKPLFVDKNDELVQKLLKAYNTVMETNLTPIAIGGGTYARAMSHGVGFGPVFPGKESCAHEADEHFSVEDFEKSFSIYYEAIKNLCF